MKTHRSTARSTRRCTFRATLGVLAAFAATAAGCGYTSGTGLADQGVRTVFLEVAGNETYRQRLEAELSSALSRELAVSSDLQPATASRADAVLQIVITAERERTLVPGYRPDPVREGSQEAAVRMRLVRRLDGKLLIDRVLVDRAEFRDPIGEDLTSAREELVSDLARKIALALEAGF